MMQHSSQMLKQRQEAHELAGEYSLQLCLRYFSRFLAFSSSDTDRAKD